MRSPTRLLSGVQVLDLTNVLAGPFCTYQLALQGADVLKVEMPVSGDLARQLGADPALNHRGTGSSFLAQNAGKRSLTLNLKDERGKAILAELAEDADVLVENFRPGVLASLGFGWDELRSRNAGLVYCAISGFGADGPMADRPAYDQIVQGLSGVMDVTGQRGGGPTRAGFPICDTLGGMTAAFAITAALVRRAATGEGAHLDVSMLDSAVAGLGWAVSNWLIGGQELERMGNDNFTASPSGAFATADGLLNIAANQQGQFVALCDAVGRPDLAIDVRFAERADRLVNRPALNAELTAALAARPATEWEVLLNPLGVPAARVLSIPEVVELDQLEHRQLVAEVGTVPGTDRPLRVVTAGFHVDGRAARPSTAPPVLGADVDHELARLGRSSAEISRLRSEGVL
ncbi:MAG TPA: CoA transferase [Acidimicrobiales bacterium]|nr:CoA transferase [Acidimicrobiales bacterium]